MLAGRLKMLRDEKKLTMKDLANLLGLTIAAYNKYEKGESEPSIKNLVRLAEFYGVSIDYLLGRTNIRDPQIIDKANIQNSFLQEFEMSDIGDTSKMYFLIENLSNTINKYNSHFIREDELLLFLKTINDITVYFNDMVEIRRYGNNIDRNLFDMHRKLLCSIMDNINIMFAKIYYNPKAE